jgi:hypothetical protein
MASKLRNKKVAQQVEETPEPVEDLQIGSDRCIEWCFLPGISHIGQSGLLQCILSEDHEEEHKIQVEILSPPSGKFTISWTT